MKKELLVASRISGVGKSVPEKVVTNKFFEGYLETSDEWIQERTGIKERRWVESNVSASELSEPACREAIKAAGLSASDIDGVIVATTTPDYIFPSTACMLQKRLGIGRGPAFDLNAACSGFIYSLSCADSLIASGQCNNILIVGVDLYSRLIDFKDRSTCILFGDGAGAAVVSSVAAAAQNSKGPSLGYQNSRLVKGDATSTSAIYASDLTANGGAGDILCAARGSAKEITPESLLAGEHYIQMQGRDVFKLAVRSLAELSENLMQKVGIDVHAVDYIISHQANKRILLAMAKQMGVAEERVLFNVERYGNTSAASVPLLLAEAVQNGPAKKGDLLLLSAFGAGLTWGAVLVRL